MRVIRWEPFGDVDTLFSHLVPSLRRLALESSGKKLDWAPSADISETDKEYVIRAELPAVAKEDVQVTLDDGVITIKGERKQHKDDKNEKFHRVESFYGSFERSFSLSRQRECGYDPLREQGRDSHRAHSEDRDAEAKGKTDHRPVTGAAMATGMAAHALPVAKMRRAFLGFIDLCAIRMSASEQRPHRRLRPANSINYADASCLITHVRAPRQTSKIASDPLAALVTDAWHR
jgi:HSP20 family protein